MLAILSIVIGIVFVLLLFSMLVSALVEMIHAILSNRGRHLRYTIESMLGDKADDFLKHPLFRQLAYATRHRNVTAYISHYSFPSWISKNTFNTILADILKKEEGASLPEKILALKDRELKDLLSCLHDQAGGNPLAFEKKVEEWFEEVMDRAKDWFGRATKWRLFAYGFLVAAAYNVDTIQIYKSLSANAATREEMVNLASAFVERDSARVFNTPRDTTQAKANLSEIRQTFIQSVQTPLGLGWYQNIPASLIEWLIKLAGLLITGVAVTMGAPFWFDLLKKFLSLRSGSSEKSGESGSNASAKKETEAPLLSAYAIQPGKQAKSEKTDKADETPPPEVVG